MRCALLLAYDGTAYRGWSPQGGTQSVAAAVATALARLGENALPHGAARTDAGVHARGQIAHVDLARTWEPARLAASLNRHLPGDIACRGVAAVAHDWDAIAAATGKIYTYRIDNGAAPDPFAAHFAWRPPFRIDLATVQQIAARIPGERDWSAFARRGETRRDARRTIDAVDWHADGDSLVCTLHGNGFTYRLVRALVGAMVAVAHGGAEAAALDAALAGTPTGAARQQAPARGLTLETVRCEPAPVFAAP